VIHKHKHHLLTRCLCLRITASLDRAKRGPPARDM
jgi:hypothetical protein